MHFLICQHGVQMVADVKEDGMLCTQSRSKLRLAQHTVQHPLQSLTAKHDCITAALGTGAPAAKAMVGIAEPIMGLQNLSWDCRTYRGIAEPIMGLQNLSWDCRTYRGIAEPIVGLQNLSWDCKTYHGTAEPIMPLC